MRSLCRGKRLPDCWCVVSIVDPQSKEIALLGKMEIIQQMCSPQWTTALWLDYEYGTKKYFQVKVLRHSNTHGHKSVGSALFEVSDILGSNRTKVKRFPQGGVIIAQLRVVPSGKENAVFRFRLRTMQPKLRFSVYRTAKVMDTLVELTRRRTTQAGDSWMVIYRSSPVFDSELPSWDDAEVNLDTGSQEELLWPM